MNQDPHEYTEPPRLTPFEKQILREWRTIPSSLSEFSRRYHKMLDLIEANEEDKKELIARLVNSWVSLSMNASSSHREAPALTQAPAHAESK